MAVFVSPPQPEIAASAPRTAIIRESMSGKPSPFHSETKMFFVSGAPSSPPPMTGTLPNLTKPVRISPHVSAWNRAATTRIRKPSTTTILKLISTLSEL